MQRYEIISTYILHYSAKNPSRGKFIYITREFELDHEGNSSTSRCNFKFIIICKSRCIFQHYDGILSTRSWYIVNLFEIYHRAVDTLLSVLEYISLHFSYELKSYWRTTAPHAINIQKKIPTKLLVRLVFISWILGSVISYSSRHS